ncbi:hypothetical protein TrVGV298_006150 [Trichoderma virens]|nr:hypothetical protein TrVGV298_006150 [Trichoderma virens]
MGRFRTALSSYLKPKSKKHDVTRESPSLVSDAEVSSARSAVSLIPPVTSQETRGAINDQSIESRTDAIEETGEIVEIGKEKNNGCDLWSRAYQKLDDKTKKWVGDASKNESGEARSQDLITLVRKREEEYKDATPKLRIGDSEIMWRDYANRVVTWVTAIGDISINFAPAPSSAVWSAVKVLLKANVSQCEDLTAIFGCAEKVLRLIRHGNVYEEVYLSDGSYNTATQNLQDALVDLYKALMELLAHAFTRLNEGQGKQFLRALVSGGEGGKAIASQEHQKLLKNLDEPLRSVEDAVKKLLEKIEDGALEQALEYISDIPIGEHQQEKREARTPTTCEWLLNHSRFIEWERSSHSSTLWLQGNVGAGKSFLTSKVIDHLPATRQQQVEDDEDALDECEMDTREALARIFCSLVGRGKGTVKVFIASRKEADIEEYLGLQRLVEITTADNKDDIEKYIEEEVTKIGGAWRSVSVDVKEQVKKTIGEKSDGMFRWAYLQWQQLKTLRTNERIRERLGKLPESLTEAYDEIYSKNEEKDVLERVVKWVLCARKPLTSKLLLTAIRLESNLRSFALSNPLGESNIQSLNLSDPIDESTLESICSHLVVLDTQLKVWKFPHASVAEYFENQHKSWIDKAPEDVAILLVSSLIDCYSKWTLPESDDEIEEFFKMTPDLENHLDPRHPLQLYARRYWLQHLQNTPNQSQEATGLSEILKCFLGANGPQKSSSRQYQAWCRHMSLTYDLVHDHHRDIRPSEKSIFGICILGLHKLLKGWWDKDINVSQVNSRRLDLLAIAARYGHDELCSELISRGSDINKKLDGGEGSALMEAIHGRQIQTVKLLLDKGADPNLIGSGTSPLCQAVQAVQAAEDLLEPLLEAGADPNITCPRCMFGCALEAAAYQDKFNSAELLIKCGANVNLATERNWCGSLLARAAYWGSLKCAKLFVTKGAEVNAHLSGDYGSVLAAAILGYIPSVEMVKYLIEEAEADPTILSSSPPPDSPWIYEDHRRQRQEIAEYLIKGGSC